MSRHDRTYRLTLRLTLGAPGYLKKVVSCPTINCAKDTAATRVGVVSIFANAALRGSNPDSEYSQSTIGVKRASFAHRCALVVLLRKLFNLKL